MLRALSVQRRVGRGSVGFPFRFGYVTTRNPLTAVGADPSRRRTTPLSTTTTTTSSLTLAPLSDRPRPTMNTWASTRVTRLPSSLRNSAHQCTQTRNKVFVSRYNDALNITAQMILDQCSNYGIEPHECRTTRTHVIVKECPFCEKPTDDKPSNQHKLYVNVGSGCYFCHRCGAKGSWFDFKMSTERFDVVSIDGKGAGGNQTVASRAAPSGHDALSPSFNDRTSGPRTGARSSPPPCLPMPSERLAACYISSLVDQPNSNPVLDYLLNVRGLEKTTLRKYGVGRATYNFPSDQANQRYVAADCVTFPWIMKASEVAEQEQLRGAKYQHSGGIDEEATDSKPQDAHITRRIKARALEEKAWQRLDPPGGGWGLFGFHTIPDDATEVIITEGEYDAMAVYQATGRPAVSLPNGCRSLPVEVLPMLERFEKVYLWMDNDAPGQEGSEKFAKKIGQNRCLIVRPNSQGEDAPKDANEALLMGTDLQKMLDNAKVLPHEMVLSFEDLRSSVIHEIVHPDKYVGAPVPSLPQFTSIIKGFRRGEVTVLTGPTGSGKTTFLGQLSLDFAEQAINTLWGSFEIKNTRLMQKLLQQFSREPLPVGKPEMAPALEALADRFQALPMYFMKFHGGSDVDDVLDAMDYAVYVHDVEHIILDNMQFMISRQSVGRGTFDKFDVQDIAIEKFRKFATDRNVHVTLVVHPRKEDEGAKLGMSSIYGSAKATQEADTVLILQNDGRRKYVEVKKNRFDGTLGYAPLHFERGSGRYSENANVGTDTQQTPPIQHSKIGKIQATLPLIPAKHSAADSTSNIDNHWDSILGGNK